jgi:hypothetical protein
VQTWSQAKVRQPVENRVARWFIFKPKITICVNFGVLVMKNVGILHDHFVYFTAMCIFHGHFVYFVVILLYFLVILVYFLSLGMSYLEKSGNPGGNGEKVSVFFQLKSKLTNHGARGTPGLKLQCKLIIFYGL